MSVSFDRLRRMTYEECAWRGIVLARDTVDRLRARVRAPRWDRRDLRRALAVQVVDSETADAIAREDWRSVHERLLQRLQQRAGRFPLDASAAGAVRREVLSRWPGAATDASARADRVLAGRYDLLGYRGLTFPSAVPRGQAELRGVDWHFDPVHRRRAPMRYWADVSYLDPAIGDHKIIWELNRHQHWLQLGRAWWLTRQPRYATAIIDRLDSWLAANPPLTGVNWASMLEIGLRAISWTYAIHFLIADIEGHATDVDTRPWLVDMLVALDRQLRHAEEHLSYYFSPNTHLTGEALALYVVGSALPELAASDRWRDTGRRILLREIDRQILADGGHVERSTHYQRYTLDFYLLALLTAERHGDVTAVAALTDAVTRLAEFTRTMADDRGRLPCIGDDDGGMLWPISGRECHDVRDSLAAAAVVLVRPDLAPWELPEEVFWIAPSASTERAPMLERSRARGAPACSRTLPDTGYVVARVAGDGHAVFDVGADGHMSGAHAHADALSLTLNVTNRALLVDPGTSTYTMDPLLRQRMRRTANHNTITVDRQTQSEPAGPFHWRAPASARLHASRHNAGFDWAEASHDGYSPNAHRRSLIRADGAGWLVVDEIVPLPVEVREPIARCHSAELHWHFDPAWMLRADAPGRLRARHFEGAEAWLLHDGGDLSLIHGDEESGLGWYAPVYGTLIPTWTARVTRRDAPPFSMITWIVPVGETARDAPTLDRLDAIADPAGPAIIARVTSGSDTSVFLLRPGEPSSRDSRACGVLDYQTNARVLHFRTHTDRLVTLDLVDASHALALRDGWISIEASEPIADLHAVLGDGALTLASSKPPQQLRVQGHDISRFHEIALNGRPYVPAPMEGPDALLIPSSEWGTCQPPVRTGARFASPVARETA